MQGDPLSPFLFVFVGEMLSEKVMAAGDANLIRGFISAPEALFICHLQLADDTVIFYAAEEDQIKNVKATLLCYEAVSGFNINFFKSELLRVRVEDNFLSHFADSLDANQVMFQLHTFGCFFAREVPPSLGALVVERVERKLPLWKLNTFLLGNSFFFWLALSNLPMYS